MDTALYCTVLVLLYKELLLISTVSCCRAFRIMDDDGSKSLSYDEFKKGLHDYGMSVTDSVRNK